MAKKKSAKAKGKARTKKLSVKKRPVKDLDARKAKSLKGGITGNFSDSRAVKLTSDAVKVGAFPTVADKTWKPG
jgi:hypothetical protein